jgi:two-component system NtrC family response regulator
MAKILVISSDANVRDHIGGIVAKMGHVISDVSTLKDGLAKIRRESFDIVYVDVRMPDGSGLDVLSTILAAPCSPEVFVLSKFGDPDEAELAIKKGAWDYLKKPVAAAVLGPPLERALQYRSAKTGRRTYLALSREKIIGDSPGMKRCLDSLAQAASSQANVLIEGETGTGKELFASAIHENSDRQNGHFVVVDCAALPETLVESMLFGHTKGAFTSAHEARSGLIKEADLGTLFLDEVGELPLLIQKAFLRVLQEKRFRPIGGEKEIRSDFRLIAATNRDLNAMVRAGAFRKDLLYRLRTLHIEIPPLRDHLEDIRDLVLFYSSRLCDQYGTAMKGFSQGFWNLLMGYSWPGNVRELIQALESAILVARNEPLLFSKHLPLHIRIQVARTTAAEKAGEAGEDLDEKDSGPKIERWNDARNAGLQKFEREYLLNLLSSCDGDIEKSVTVSGLSKARLYALLKKHGLTPLKRKR